VVSRRALSACLALTLALLASLSLASTSSAAALKAIWGPTVFNGAAPDTAFDLYEELGVDVFQLQLDWSKVATARPANPTDPADPAYHWPGGSGSPTVTIAQAPAGMEVALLVKGTPAWAATPPQPGAGVANQVPDDVGDFADFLTAASVKYPAVRRWMIWGETNRMAVWRSGPASYARLLDASYGAIKAADGVPPGGPSEDVVIGGMTFTYGETSPAAWIAAMRLPSGAAPRLDEYGHNPFTRRCPDLSQGPNYLAAGARDISDIDTLKGEVDAAFGAGRKLWLSEFTVSSDRANRALDFFLTRDGQADWLSKAFAIAGSVGYVSGIGWFNLHDEPATILNGLTTGLMTFEGLRKPAFAAYAAARLDGTMPVVACPQPPPTPPPAKPPPPPPVEPAHFDVGVGLRATRLSAMLRKGYAVRAACPSRCSVVASIVLDRKTARKLRLARKAVALGTAKASLTGGAPRTLTVKVARRYKRKLGTLERLSLILKVSARSASGDVDGFSRRLSLRR
jgi:hypothetical protein